MTSGERLEILFKEVDLIEAVIQRMASNVFLVKGWAIAVITATLVLESNCFLIALVPLAGFWYLDACYLHKERLFRKLYDWVVANRLKTDEYLLSLDTSRFRSQVVWGKVLGSWSLLGFYLPLLAVIGVMLVVR